MLIAKDELKEYLDRDNLIGLIVLETYIDMYKHEFKKHVKVVRDFSYKEELTDKVFYLLRETILDSVVDLGIELSMLDTESKISLLENIDYNFKQSLNNYLVDTSVEIDNDYKYVVKRIYEFIYSRIVDVCRMTQVIGVNDKPLLGEEIFDGVLVFDRVDTRLKLAVYGDASWRRIPNT